LTIDYSLLLLIAGAMALVMSGLVVVRNWTACSLPVKLIPLDILTVILLIDLNLKSNSNITIQDPLMKMEAIAFTGLFAFVLFAPVVYRVVLGPKKSSAR
jgi:hypothetical protein